MHFKMSVQGGLLPPIFSQIQKCLNLICGRGQHFSKISEIQKMSELSGWVGGSGQFGNISQIFARIYFDGSSKNISPVPFLWGWGDEVPNTKFYDQIVLFDFF